MTNNHSLLSADSPSQAGLGLWIEFKILFLCPKLSRGSLLRSSCPNNGFSSWSRSSAAIAPRHLHNEAASLLISFSLNCELVNSHSGWLCCCSASAGTETKQTMGVIEKRIGWHYWILITSFPHQHWTRQLRGCKLCLRGMLECTCRKWLERTASGSSGSHCSWKKVVSGYQRTQPCLDRSVLSQRQAPSIWRGALIIPHQWLNQHLIISSLRLLWRLYANTSLCLLSNNQE